VIERQRADGSGAVEQNARLAVAFEFEELLRGGLGHDHAVDREETRGAGQEIETLRSVRERRGFDAPGMDDPVDTGESVLNRIKDRGGPIEAGNDD
jgi:hypothetical protein